MGFSLDCDRGGRLFRHRGRRGARVTSASGPGDDLADVVEVVEQVGVAVL